MGIAAVRGERARRCDLRTRQLGLEVERACTHRSAPRLGGTPARRDQARDRGPGGSRQRPEHVSDLESRAVPVGRDADLRHGQRSAGRADADGGPARHRAGDDRADDAGRPEAQRPVRRRGARCADRASACARVAARRARRRRGGGSSPRGVDRRVPDRRGVPRAGRGAARAAAHGHRRSRLTDLVRPGDHDHRHRRALGRERAERRLTVRAGEDQPPRASRTGRARSAGRAGQPPRERAPLRDRRRGAPRGDGQRLRGRRVRARRTRQRARR